MHDGTVAAGAAWLQANIDGYARWAVDHNSLLVVTFDECDPAEPAASTPIATIIIGAGVKVGTCEEQVNLYSILLLIEAIYGLPLLDQEAVANRIAGIWE
jgi:acid phosphatase